MSELEASLLAQAGKAPKAETQPKEETTAEVVKKSNARDFGVDIDPEKTYVFETLMKSETPRHEILGAMCKIFDPIEQRIREIRYIPSAGSIFVEDQDKQDPELKRRDLPYVGFYFNQLVVLGEDQRLVEFLLAHDRYDGNKRPLSKEGAKFRLVDKEQYNTAEKKRHSVVLDALKMIEETKEEDLMPVARIIFGITDESETGTLNKLRELVMKPKGEREQQTNADKLLNNLNDPLVRRKYTVQQAIDKGILKVESDKVLWGEENGAFITSVASKNNPVSQISDIAKYSMTKDGERFYKILKEKSF